MSFQTPAVLLALLGLPLLLAFYVRRERRARRTRDALVPPALMAAVAPRRPRWRRHGAVALQALALAVLIVALARPQATRAVPVEQATVVIATDRSGSMLARDVAPSRLEAARRAAGRLIDTAPDDLRIGIVAFNHAPTVLQSPTRDRAAAHEALAGVRAAGSTATGDALATALRLARTASGRRAPAAIVLLSDGKSVRGRDALAVADEARAARIPVYTVALGTASGTIEGSDGSSQPVPPDPDTLRRIAERTNGRAYAIADADRLAAVYERLGSELSTEQRTEEMTSVAAGLGLVLLLAGVAAPLRWFGRLA